MVSGSGLGREAQGVEGAVARRGVVSRKKVRGVSRLCICSFCGLMGMMPGITRCWSVCRAPRGLCGRRSLRSGRRRGSGSGMWRCIK